MATSRIKEIQNQEDFDCAIKLFNWNKYLLSTLGLWPNNPNNFIFIINIGYFIYNMFCEYLDLLLFIDNFDNVIENLTENVELTQILVRMLMLKKYNHQLGVVINEALNDYDNRLYNNINEKKVFLDYINEAKLFVKLLCGFISITVTFYFTKPITSRLSSPNDNGDATMDFTYNSTMPFILPYRFYIFYEINDFKSYTITYALQLPFLLISAFGHAAADCLMVTLVFHVSGKLSVLAMKIRSINSHGDVCKEELRVIIQEHTRLLRIGGNISDAFSATLLAHLFGATTLVCIIGYQLLVNYAKGQGANLVTFFFFISLVFLILFTHCFVGETLITESDRLREAFYDCLWYEMPQETAKLITLCIKRSQKPLSLSAGKFGIFCLRTLTESVKTAMAYLSVLRSCLLDG